MGQSQSRPEQNPAPPVAAFLRQIPELNKPWRDFAWDQKLDLKKHLEDFTPSNPDVKEIKILVAGQVAAGKSSFINSVNNAFQGRITSAAIVDGIGGKSFTKELKAHKIRSDKSTLPFVLNDIMGLEPEVLAGSQPEDIIRAVYGHVKDGYKFDEENPLDHTDEHFIGDPIVSDQAFCLVYVIEADTISITDDKLIDKLRIIRQRISQKRIPQVIVMTKVDEACPLVKEDLRKIYTSKKIKEKMEMCSQKLGVPMNCIFPVKNYHDEIDTKDDVDVLILKAFEQIVHLADDRLRTVESQTELQLNRSKAKEGASTELEKPWRKFDWGQKEQLKSQLEKFSVSNPDVQRVRILVAGQVGAGKSSFINSVNSAFQGEIVTEALADSTAGQSFTKNLSTYQIRNEHGELPFVIGDIMGLEAELLSGLQVDDIISTIFGHVMEDYTFKENKPITSEDEEYKQNPSVSDQTFCLVYIIAANTIHMIDQLFDKLRLVRLRIKEKGLPQVVVLTKVDEACPLVNEDLKKIYTSKKIKEMMEVCSQNLGVPMTCIFPVKNYHDEIDTEDDVDVLILKAFEQIVRSANKRLMKGALN